MLRNQVLILLGVGLLATSTAWADDVGFVDCLDHPRGVEVLSLFSDPPNSQVVASLPCGEQFTILMFGEAVAHIRTKDGKVGYLDIHLISRGQPPARVLSLQECKSLGASLNKTLAGPGADEMWKRLANDTEVVALKTLLNCGKLVANARDFELSSGLYELALRAGIARGAQLEADNTTLINAYNQLLTQATEYAASVQEYVARVQNWVAAQQAQSQYVPAQPAQPLTRWQRFKQGLNRWAEYQAEYQRQHPTVNCTAQTYSTGLGGSRTEMTCR